MIKLEVHLIITLIINNKLKKQKEEFSLPQSVDKVQYSEEILFPKFVKIFHIVLFKKRVQLILFKLILFF